MSPNEEVGLNYLMLFPAKHHGFYESDKTLVSHIRKDSEVNTDAGY